MDEFHPKVYAETIGEMLSLLSKLDTRNISCMEEHPLMIVIESLMKDSIYRKILIKHKLLNCISMFMFSELRDFVTHKQYIKMWNSLSYLAKLEFFMLDDKISDICYEDETLAKALTLADRDIAQWSLGQAIDTNDWVVVRIILANAPAGWISIHKDDEENMKEAGADPETLELVANMLQAEQQVANNPHPTE